MENTSRFLLGKCYIIRKHLDTLNNKEGVLDNVQKKELFEALRYQQSIMSLFRYPEIKHMLKETGAWRQMVVWNWNWNNQTEMFRKNWKELDCHIKTMVRNLSCFDSVQRLDVSMFLDKKSSPVSNPQW